jgi:hypothetical protein
MKWKAAALALGTLLIVACRGNAVDVGGTAGSGPGNGGGAGGPPMGVMTPGGDCPADLGFPGAATLTNLVGEVLGANVRLTFDQPAGAADYRVYVLPQQGDVSGSTNKNAVYRCAGEYEVPFIPQDLPTDGQGNVNLPQGSAYGSQVNSVVVGYPRTTSEATLGYVFTSPGPNLVPVYALGRASTDAEQFGCGNDHWPEAREETYTPSAADRATMLAQRWRDDGIAFYALDPATTVAGTTVVSSMDTNGAGLYLVDGPELTKRKADGASASPAFAVYAQQMPGAVPLMRVYYLAACSRGHDELTVGETRFNKAYTQWPHQPVGELHWAGLTAETTLVVEALDALCPYSGTLSPTSLPAVAGQPPYPAFSTLDELRAASPSGEVFLNGQGDATTPHAIARACLEVAPAAPAPMDWRYDGSPEAYGPVQSFSPDQARFEFDSPTFDVQLLGQTKGQWTFGAIFGELWTLHADVGADVGNLFRFAPKQTPTLAADAFVHVSMEVDTVSTFRRYPQIIVSDQPTPVQQNLTNGASVIVQPFGVSGEVQIEFCDHRDWEVNNQCPYWDLATLHDQGVDFLSPRVEMTGLQGVDRTVTLDAYVSTQRVYAFVNGAPYGCVDLPPGSLTAGPGTVTFGDVLYHSGADLSMSGFDWFPFHDAHMAFFMSRHFSNLAFSSAVPQPTWDYGRFPCVPATAIQDHP